MFGWFGFVDLGRGVFILSGWVCCWNDGLVGEFVAWLWWMLFERIWVALDDGVRFVLYGWSGLWMLV